MKTLWKVIKKLFLAGVILTSVGILAIAIMFYVYSKDLPDYNKMMRAYRPLQVVDVYTADKKVVARLYKDQKRTVVYSLPAHVIKPFIAAEDPNFYNNPGVDWWEFVKTMFWRNPKRVVKGKRPTGASTITMQLVKRMATGAEASVKRKMQEMVIAYRLTKKLSKKATFKQAKDQILLMYVNDIHMGGHTYGIYEAAKKYFAKEPKDLTMIEAAVLAGQPKAPSYYNPLRNLKASENRARYVLQQMLDHNMITQKDYEVLSSYPIGKLLRKAKNQYMGSANHLVYNYIAYEKTKILKEQFYRCGHACDIQLTINSEMQLAAVDAVQEGTLDLERKRSQIFRGALNTRIFDTSTQLNELVPERAYKAKVLGNNQVQVGKVVGSLDTDWIKEWAAQIHEGDIVLVTYKPKRRNKLTFRLENVPQIQAALIAVRPNGEIAAVVDGPFFEFNQTRHITAKRQIGSTIKPFVATMYLRKYNVSIDQQIPNHKTAFFTNCHNVYLDPNDYNAFISSQLDCRTICKANRLSSSNKVCVDTNTKHEQGWHVKICQTDGFYSPHNHGGLYSDFTTVADIVAKSINLGSINMLCDLGTRKQVVFADNYSVNLCINSVEIFKNDMKDMFNINIPEQAGLSIGLGSIEISPLELTAMFNTINNGGKYIFPYYTPGQATLEREVLTEAEAFRTKQLLEAVIERGTGIRAKYKLKKIRNKAGKTGTTNENKDSWFAGMIPELTVVVWVGKDQHETILRGKNGEGSRTALPIWIYFMEKLLKNRLIDPKADWNLPPAGDLIQPTDADGITYSNNGVGVTADEIIGDDDYDDMWED